MIEAIKKCTSKSNNPTACYLFLASDAKFDGLEFKGMKRKYGKYKRPVLKFNLK